MSGQDSPAPEADNTDSLLSMIDWHTDSFGTIIAGEDVAAFFQLTPLATIPQPLLQSPPPPPLAQSREFGVLGLSLPDTPVEPAGPQHSFSSCGGGGGEGFWDGLALSSGEESTAFRFPPVSVSAALSLRPQQVSTLLPSDYDEVFIETPPDTPTDPHSLFVDSFPSSQQQHLYPYRPPPPPPPPPQLSSTSTIHESFLDTPPRRQGLQGTSSNFEDEDEVFQEDLDLPDDLSDFSSTEIPAALEEEEEEVVEEASSAQDGGYLGAECLGHLPALLEDDFPHLDPSLRQAWEQSQGSQSLSPLLKQELKLKIMKKRLENGQEELSVDFSPSPVCQRTEQEEARLEVRRAQNRGAARRCRLRKKKKEEEMIKKQEESLKLNRRLRQDVARLRAEVTLLRAQLLHHRRHCPLAAAAAAAGDGDGRPLPAFPHLFQEEDLALGDLTNVAAPTTSSSSSAAATTSN